jgi:hypothetical protein
MHDLPQAAMPRKSTKRGRVKRLYMFKWTEKAPFDDESGLPAVTWMAWARETIEAIRSGPEDRRATAVKTLNELAFYLDDQYDSGYDGIAPLPRSGCNMSWDW